MVAGDVGDVREVAGVCQKIHVDDFVGGMAPEPISDEVRGDESRAASDQETHPGHYLQMVALVIGASGLVGGALCRTPRPIAGGPYHTGRIPEPTHLDACHH